MNLTDIKVKIAINKSKRKYCLVCGMDRVEAIGNPCYRSYNHKWKELPKPKVCDCWKYENRVCDICQKIGKKKLKDRAKPKGKR